jgi:hypothetical protein
MSSSCGICHEDDNECDSERVVSRCNRCNISVCRGCSVDYGPDEDYESAQNIRGDVLFELSCYFPFGVDGIILDYVCWPIFPPTGDSGDDYGGRFCDRCTGRITPSSSDLLQEALKLLGITKNSIAEKVRKELEISEDKRSRQVAFDSLCTPGDPEEFRIQDTDWVDSWVDQNKDRANKRKAHC